MRLVFLPTNDSLPAGLGGLICASRYLGSSWEEEAGDRRRSLNSEKPEEQELFFWGRGRFTVLATKASHRDALL